MTVVARVPEQRTVEVHELVEGIDMETKA